MTGEIRPPTTSERIRGYLRLAVFLAVVICAWRAVTLPRWQPGDIARESDWESARPSDCHLLGQAVTAYDRRHGRASLPLWRVNIAPGPCRWTTDGAPMGQLAKAQFEAATQHGARYLAHRVVGRPRYSLFHLRASVITGRQREALDGDGEECQFIHGPTGWHLQRCREAWIS